METEMMVRAQYNSGAARTANALARKYTFETPIEVDDAGNYYHHLIVTRLADGIVVADEKHYSTDKLDDAICDWRVQLGLSTLNSAMMGL